MANQLIEDGKTVEVNGQDFECTAVSYQENSEGEKQNFAYTFRLKAEVDAEREAEAKHQEELKAAQEAANADTEAPAEEVSQPEPLEEETQYVK